MSDAERGHAAERITAIRQRLADLEARLPTHSVPPAMMLEMEALEEELEQLQEGQNQRMG
jgi:hypothetical protein